MIGMEKAFGLEQLVVETRLGLKAHLDLAESPVGDVALDPR